MTQGDERWNSLTDDEFYADLAARHGRGVAKVASTVVRQRHRQVPLKVGVKRKPRKALPTRRVDEFDRLRHGEPPLRLPATRRRKS